jgi:hypothetical protein
MGRDESHNKRRKGKPILHRSVLHFNSTTFHLPHILRQIAMR